MSAKVLLRALNRIAESDIKQKRTEGFTHIDSRRVQCGAEHAYRLPSGYSTYDVQKNIDVLVGAVGAPVELIDRAGAVVVRVVEKDFPSKLHFKPADLSADKLLIGYDRLMRPAYHRPMHMLAGGAAGSGKTLWLKWMLYQLAGMNAFINIVDMKGFSYFPFESLPAVTAAKNMEDAAGMLEKACIELERREQLIISRRDRSIIKSFPYYVVVIDEAAQLAPKMHAGAMKKIAGFCDEKIARIAQKGRETKVILIYCTQRPDASIINGQVKSNVEAAVAFRTYTDYDSRIILNAEGAEKISVATPGRCIFRGDRFYTLQVPFISESDRDWEKLLAPLKTEVLNHGHSHRTPAQRQYLEGSYTSAVRDDKPARKAQRFTRPLQESIVYLAAVGGSEVGRVGISSSRETMAAYTAGPQDDGRYSDEIDED